MSIILQEGENRLDVQMMPFAPPMANLSGIVTDAETGLAIRDVRVTIHNGITLEAFTDSSGQYQFTDLTPGSYWVTFEKDGYYPKAY